MSRSRFRTLVAWAAAMTPAILVLGPEMAGGDLIRRVRTGLGSIGKEPNLSAPRIRKSDWASAARPNAMAKQFEFDQKLWLATLFPSDRAFKPAKAREIRRILARIIGLYHFGGLRFRTSPSAGWTAFPYPTGSLLSHGSRVLVALRKEGGIDRFALSNWIATGRLAGHRQKGNPTAGFKRRIFGSSHYVSFEEKKSDGIREVKLKGLKMLLGLQGCWAMNLPLGGFGSEDAQGKPVRADGRHGHLLFYHRVAAKKSPWLVGYLIGFENSEPLGFSKPYPMKSHLGTVHDVKGTSTPVSLTGGRKWRAMGSNTPAEIDGLRIVIGSKRQLLDIVRKTEKVIEDEGALARILASKPQPPN
jgi:hypothetical protein